jgi:hypothetical protein
MPKAYHITDWDDRENAETRKYVDLVWFRNKVKLLGEGLGHTLGQPRGPHLYGMFKLIEQVAAGGRLEQRGWLYRNDSPLDAPRIASLLRLPLSDVEEALTFFATPPMNWLEYVDLPGDFASRKAKTDFSQEKPGRNAEDSPGSQEKPGRNAASDRPTDRSTPTDQRLKIEKEKEDLDSRELRKRQSAQFCAADARLQKLEAVPREERSEAQRAEIKKTRGIINAIQKKQAANDWTPVEEIK